MSRRGHTTHSFHRFRFVMLAVAGLLAVVSFAAALRAYAMPVEARTTEAWYSYKSTVGFGYTSHVLRGRFYEDSVVRSDQLARVRLPQDPPAFRRVLISLFTEDVEVTIPYRFAADRPAPLRARFRVDGVLQMPGVWEKPYPLAPSKETEHEGTEIGGSVTFRIPVSSLLAEISSARKEHNLVLDPLELHIKPVFEVEVEGLRQPVQITNAGELKMVFRANVLEIDEPKELRADKALSETRIVPIMLSLLGTEVTVVAARQASMAVLALSALLISIMLWRRHRSQELEAVLRKLGPNLITARSYEMPSDTAVADLKSVKELVQIHLRTERPVIKAGGTYYLVDDSICYRFALREQNQSMPEHVPEPAAVAEKPASRRPGSPGVVIQADEFILDSWITNVQVRTVHGLTELQRSTGRAIIRTSRGYHLIDGSVCFTYSDQGPEQSPAADS